MSDDDLELIRLTQEGSGSSRLLRIALEEAKRDVPTPDDVESMLARFPFPTPGGPGGAGPSGDGGPGTGSSGGSGGGPPPDAIGGGGAIVASSGSGVAVKTTAAICAAGICVGSIALMLRNPAPDPPPLPQRTNAIVATATVAPTVAVATSSTSLPDIVASSQPDTPATSSTSPRSAWVSRSIASASVSASAPARPELEILKEAHAALHSNPSRALQLVDEHASAYPKSGVAQEREMIRMEALLNSGRRAEAKAIADAFRARNPKSAYAQRLDALGL
ncbi:MAG: hypothetical protein HOW73_37475 [Polyangiaceae bacterium]|nr:hypothetical protein [Polyangiaceae bacterium]